MRRVVCWIGGGLCAGLGMMFMLGAFGATGFGLMIGDVVEPAALSFASFGYDASSDVSLTGNGKAGIGLLITGIALMIGGGWGVYDEMDHSH